MCFGIKTKVFNVIKFVMLDENDYLDYNKYVNKGKIFVNNLCLM